MLTPERFQQLRVYPTMARTDEVIVVLAEIDRLRAELDAAHDRVPAELGWDGVTTEAQRLRAELEGAKDAYAELEFTVSDLNAENEALREAGGDVYDCLLAETGDKYETEMARWREVVGER